MTKLTWEDFNLRHNVQFPKPVECLRRLRRKGTKSLPCGRLSRKFVISSKSLANESCILFIRIDTTSICLARWLGSIYVSFRRLRRKSITNYYLSIWDVIKIWSYTLCKLLAGCQFSDQSFMHCRSRTFQQIICLKSSQLWRRNFQTRNQGEEFIRLTTLNP